MVSPLPRPHHSLHAPSTARPSHLLLGPMDKRTGNQVSAVVAETVGFLGMYQGSPSISQGAGAT